MCLGCVRAVLPGLTGGNVLDDVWRIEDRAHGQTTGLQGRSPRGGAHPREDIGLRYERSVRATVDVVAKLGRYDMERRQFLTGTLFAVAA